METPKENKDNTKCIGNNGIPPPNPYCCFLVNYPKLSFGLTLFGNLLIVGLSLILLLSGYDLFPTDFDSLPMYDWNVPWRRRDWAWHYRDDYENKYERKLYFQNSVNWNRANDYGRANIVLYYDAGTRNIITTDNLKSMKYIEDNVTSIEEYTNFCLQRVLTKCSKPASILRYFDGTYAHLSSVFYDPHYNNITAVLHAANTFNETKRDLSIFLAKDSEISSDHVYASYTRSVIPIGYPLHRNESIKHMEETMEKFLVKSFKPVILKLKSEIHEFNIVYWSYLLFKSDTAKEALKDIYLALGSLIFIFCFIVFHTKSLWISSLAVFSIGTSFLTSNLIYRTILGFRYFGFFHIVAMFIILGIGADDLFVFLDVWKNTAYKTYPSLAHRLSDSYRTSACSMFVTSLTTAVAFFASAFSPLLAAKSFGVFAGLLVVVNYISVIIFFPPVVITHHKYFSDCKWPCFKCIKRCSSKHADSSSAEKSRMIFDKTENKNKNNPTMFFNVRKDPIKDKTNNASTARKDRTSAYLKASHVNNAFEIDRDIIDSEIVKPSEGEQTNSNIENTNTSFNENDIAPELNIATKDRTHITRKKFLIRFFSCYYFRFVTHKICRWIILTFMMLILAVFTVSAVSLEPDNEQVQYYRSDHNYARAIDYDSHGFKLNFADRHVTVTIVWGLKPRDVSGCHFSDEHCVGVEKYDPSFNPNTPEAQLALMEFCDTLLSFSSEDVHDFHIRRDAQTGIPEIKCFMKDLQNFLERESLDSGTDWSLPWDYNKTMVFLRSKPLLYDTSKINQTFPNILQLMYTNYRLCSLNRLRLKVGLKVNMSVPAVLRVGLFWSDSGRDAFIRNIPISYWLNDGYRYKNTTDFYKYHSLIGEQVSPFSTPILTDYSVYFGNKIKYLGVEVNLTLGRFSTGYRTGRPVMDLWENFVSTQIKHMPHGLQKGFQLTHTYWHTLSIQKTMTNSAIFGIVLGIVCALPILILATQNVIIGFLATLCICCCTVCVIGVIPLAGWKLGLLESINMTMVVGLSVDYVVHLAEGYHMSKHTDRMTRVQDMLEEVGISVFSGACTTMGAAIFLLFAQIQFLIKFGIFMLSTIGFSLLFSLGCFVTIMGLFGPVGTTGDIKDLLHKLCPHKIDKHNNNHNQGQNYISKTRF